jgi:hypothetical protein
MKKEHEKKEKEHKAEDEMGAEDHRGAYVHGFEDDKAGRKWHGAKKMK